MHKIIFPFILFCLTLVNAQQNQKYININGTSELILPADQINLNVKIRIVDESIESSKKKTDKALDDLLSILKMQKVNSQEIGISPIELGKNYEHDRDRVRIQNGFYTEVTVSFLIKDLSKYFELSNKLASNNEFEIVSSSYGISDYENQHQLAYKQALKAAKHKAEYMAETLGLKLVDVLEIDENNLWQSYPNPVNSITKIDSEGGNISGKVTIRRSVRVKFAIE